MGTSVVRTTNMVDIYKIGLGFDIPCAPVDGMDPVAVHTAMDEAVQRARRGDGPTFLEARTYRYKGHSMSDPAKYRTKEEVEIYKAKDPIEVVKAAIEIKNMQMKPGLKRLAIKLKRLLMNRLNSLKSHHGQIHPNYIMMCMFNLTIHISATNQNFYTILICKQ